MIINPYRFAAVGYDADAQTFFTAAGITDTAQKDAINNLVLSLKSYGIWTKITAIYPMVGGSSSSHAVNLKSPGTYDLTFYGGWTHASTGALPNGTTGYADTGLNCNSVLSTTQGGLAIYSRTTAAPSSGGYDWGADSSSAMTATPTYLISRYSSNQYAYGYGNNSYAVLGSSTDGRGSWVGLKKSGTVYYYKNGTLQDSAVESTTQPNTNLYLGAANANGTAGYYSNKEYAMAVIFNDLETSDISNYESTNTTFQTALSRNV